MVNIIFLKTVLSNTRHGDGKEEATKKVGNGVEIEVDKIGSLKDKLSRKVILALLPELLEKS